VSNTVNTNGSSPIYSEGSNYNQEISQGAASEDKLAHIAQETLSGEHDLEADSCAELKAVFQMKTPEGLIDVLFAKGMSDRDLLWWINNV
jgi:hypothetical protein